MNHALIFSLLFAVLTSTCSSKRKGQCFSCFNSQSSVQQLYLDSSQATFELSLILDPSSNFKAVLAQSRDLVDTVDKANVEASSDDVSIVSDWGPGMTLAFLEGLQPDQSYALALLEQNSFGRIRIMEIKEFTTQAASFPKTGGIPQVTQVKKEAATITFPSAIDDATKSSEISYLVAVWKKGQVFNGKEDILQNGSGITIVQDWTQGTDQEFQEIQISGLEVETDYVVGILARDGDGNTTLLPLRPLRTLDKSAPDADAITLVSSTTTTATISWPAAQDDETPAESLEYRVLIADSRSSLENPVLLNQADSSSLEPKVLQDWTANLLQYEATGLTNGRKYYFTVLVRDRGKNLAVYRTLPVVLVDPDAPAFEGQTIEISDLGTGYTYPEGPSLPVIWYAIVAHKSSLAIDKTTPAEDIEYMAACSVDASALASLDTIAQNPSRVKRSGWVKPVTRETGYSITIDARDRNYIRDCKSPLVSMIGSYPWNPTTPELKNIVPSTIANVCKFLANYESNPVPVMSYIPTDCVYSGVAGKIYGKIFARDAEGKMATLGPQLVAYTKDTYAPTFSADPTLGNDDVLSWPAASDHFTRAEKIEYKVVAATTADAIDSVEKISAITTAADGLVMDWTPGVTSTSLNLALTGSSYTLMLAARDELGNVRLAKAQSFQDTAPIAGAALSFSTFAFNSLIISWGVASDDKTSAANFSYKLVRAAAAGDIDTIAEANARPSGDVLLDWTKATTSFELTGAQLALGSSYAVLVRDSVGQMALYSPVTRNQVVDSLQLYFDPGNTESYPGTGTTWKDLSGNGFDSTMFGGVTYLSSNGGVMDFDGVNDYVLLGNLSALKPTAAISVSTWLEPALWTGLSENKSAVSCTQSAGYAIGVTTANLILFQVLANGTYQGASASTVGFTGWKHIVGTYDGRYTKMYVNGVLSQTSDAGANYPITYIANGILIGAEATLNNTPNTQNWWIGKIGPTLIRSRAITDAEALAEFNAGKGRFGL